KLKAAIVANPEIFVDLDESMPLTLLDQKHAGKKLLLITNSEWPYTRFMMSYACDRFLPDSMTWRDLFDLVVVSARKPDFFSYQASAYQVVNEEQGHLVPHNVEMQVGEVYVGGNAALIERSLSCSGGDILYVGDHIFGDVTMSKSTLRWRTALILRELEEELTCVAECAELHEQIQDAMVQKEALEAELSALRLDIQRKQIGYATTSKETLEQVKSREQCLREEITKLDEQITPLLVEDAKQVNPYWGYLMRAGNDKSHLTRQIERHADIYTSRVSNFLYYTPFMYFRSPRGSMPHDMPK
ncbi:MAG: 5'-nucleotidase domain-containing protein, partial [Myxococcota bacterium]